MKEDRCDSHGDLKVHVSEKAHCVRGRDMKHAEVCFCACLSLSLCKQGCTSHRTCKKTFNEEIFSSCVNKLRNTFKWTYHPKMKILSYSSKPVGIFFFCGTLIEMF